MPKLRSSSHGPMQALARLTGRLIPQNYPLKYAKNHDSFNLVGGFCRVVWVWGLS